VPRMGYMSGPDIRQWPPEPAAKKPDLTALLARVARGDHQAFEQVYGELAEPVYGVIRQVRSAGLMAGPGTVLASAVVPEDRIGITVEPAGGTSKPTTTPVAVLPT
jgi:hypothetical protein